MMDAKNRLEAAEKFESDLLEAQALFFEKIDYAIPITARAGIMAEQDDVVWFAAMLLSKAGCNNSAYTYGGILGKRPQDTQVRKLVEGKIIMPTSNSFNTVSKKDQNSEIGYEFNDEGVVNYLYECIDAGRNAMPMVDVVKNIAEVFHIQPQPIYERIVVESVKEALKDIFFRPPRRMRPEDERMARFTGCWANPGKHYEMIINSSEAGGGISPPTPPGHQVSVRETVIYVTSRHSLIDVIEACPDGAVLRLGSNVVLERNTGVAYKSVTIDLGGNAVVCDVYDGREGWYDNGKGKWLGVGYGGRLLLKNGLVYVKGGLGLTALASGTMTLGSNLHVVGKVTPVSASDGGMIEMEGASVSCDPMHGGEEIRAFLGDDAESKAYAERKYSLCPKAAILIKGGSGLVMRSGVVKCSLNGIEVIGESSAEILGGTIYGPALGDFNVVGEAHSFREAMERLLEYEQQFGALCAHGRGTRIRLGNKAGVVCRGAYSGVTVNDHAAFIMDGGIIDSSFSAVRITSDSVATIEGGGLVGYPGLDVGKGCQLTVSGGRINHLDDAPISLPGHEWDYRAVPILADRSPGTVVDISGGEFSKPITNKKWYAPGFMPSRKKNKYGFYYVESTM